MSQPVNLFVAGFIGSPPMNFLPARIEGSTLRLPFVDVPVPAELAGKVAGKSEADRTRALERARVKHAASSQEPGSGRPDGERSSGAGEAMADRAAQVREGGSTASRSGDTA